MVFSFLFDFVVLLIIICKVLDIGIKIVVVCLIFWFLTVLIGRLEFFRLFGLYGKFEVCVSYIVNSLRVNIERGILFYNYLFLLNDENINKM